MSLEPFFSLSPRSPQAYTYNPDHPDVPSVFAYTVIRGATYTPTINSLEYQHKTDQAYLSHDPVSTSDQAIHKYGRQCTIRVEFNGFNVDTSHQYLLLFRLAKDLGSPVVQLFVGTSLVRAETLSQSPHDDIGILLDAPGNDMYVNVFARLAAADNSPNHGFLFKGVDCYLL